MTFDDPIDGVNARMYWHRETCWWCLSARHWARNEHIAAVMPHKNGSRILVFHPTEDGRGGLIVVHDETVNSMDSNVFIVHVIEKLVALNLVDPLQLLVRQQFDRSPTE